MEPFGIAILKVIAALFTIVLGSVTLFIIFRKRQFARPNLKLIVGWNSPPDEIPRQFRRLPVTLMVLAPSRELRQPLMAYLLLCLKSTTRETVRNVRVSIEYPQKYLVDNQLFASLAEFKPTIVADLSDSEHAVIVRSGLTKDQFEKALEAREVTVFDGRAQVTFEFPLVRPGEWFIVYDILLLPGSGPEGIEKLGFGDSGFKNILELIRGVSTLLDYFVINIFVYAENHERLNQKVSFLRFASEADADIDLPKFGNALWLGATPQGGIYFMSPFYRWLAHRMKWIGRTSKNVHRSELGLARFPPVARIETHSGATFMKELPEKARQQYFQLNVPNCNYFELPEQVTDGDALMKWLGVPKTPFISHQTIKKFKRR